MVQSINIIHPDESILNYNETTRYRYNGSEWRKNDNINLYRYTDKDISDVDTTGMDRDDYIELSKTYCNIALQSENLSDNIIWNKNDIILTKDDYFTFPDNAYSAFRMMTTSNIINTDHYISQQFINNTYNTYIFSAFVKDIQSSPYHKMAIAVKDVTYNVIISAEFDLSTINSDSTDLNITFRDATTYEEISGMSNYFTNCSAKILRIKQNDQNYFRPYITFKLLNTTHFETIIYILNNNSEYKYIVPGDSYIFYMSGAQLEKFKDDVPSVPGPYMITYKTPSQNIVPISLYGFDTEHNLIELPDNKIYYLYSSKEIVIAVKDSSGQEVSRYTKMQSSDPVIINPKNNDIAIVQSLISFGTIAFDLNNKKYTPWVEQKNYLVGDRVTYLSNLYECIETHISSSSSRNVPGFILDISKWKIILDAVGLGSTIDEFSTQKNYLVGDKIFYNSNVYKCISNVSSGYNFNENQWEIIIDNIPENCIRYNKKNKLYEIKKHDSDGDKWKILKPKDSGNNMKSLIQSLTYNQGIFETWNQQSCLIKPSHDLGYNTGGDYNFVKLSQISNKL